MRSAGLLSALVLFCAASSVAWADGGASFVCEAARLPVEQLICNTPQVAAEDVRMNYLHHAVRDKLPDTKGQARLRREQLRWLSRVRNRCLDADCLLRVYAARIEALAERNNRVVSLVGQPFEPLYTHEFAAIEDSAAAHGIALRADRSTTYHFELRMHPQDTRTWSGIGPRVDLHCTSADAQEGYAATEVHKVHYFLDFTPIDRGQGRAYRMHTLALGKDLPLHLDIRCAVGFSEWLLERPSTLVVVKQ